MQTIILAALVALTLTVVLVRHRQQRRGSSFERLMVAMPSDHYLCSQEQCVLETGHIWFFYSRLTDPDGISMLTISLNVPIPNDEADKDALDADVKELVEDLKKTGSLGRNEWRKMEGPLAMRLYLELDWKDVTLPKVSEFQGRMMEILRNRNADSVRKYFRGAGDYDIYYSEQVGNIIERSLDMVNAFDIRKYSFKSEGMLEYNEKNEFPATAEEFEELYDAAKTDIEVYELGLDDLPDHFKDLMRDGVIWHRPVLRRHGRPRYLEAWFRDKLGLWHRWAIENSGGAWWVYDLQKTELNDIFELDSEEEATDLFVRYVVEGIQDAESDEG